MCEVNFVWSCFFAKARGPAQRYRFKVEYAIAATRRRVRSAKLHSQAR